MLKKIMDNKIFKIVYGTIKTVFIVMLVLYVGFIILQKVTNNSSIMGYRFFTIASKSMFPVYDVGDVIVVNTVDTSTLVVGDDITYFGLKGDMKDKIITHRLIEIEGSSAGTIFHTQGVANPAPDPTITSNQIYGKVIYKPVVISTISKVVRNQYGFFFLVFTPLILVVFLEVADTIIETRAEKKNKED